MSKHIDGKVKRGEERDGGGKGRLRVKKGGENMVIRHKGSYKEVERVRREVRAEKKLKRK